MQSPCVTTTTVAPCIGKKRPKTQMDTNTWTMMNRGLKTHLGLKSPGVFILPPCIQQPPPPRQRWVGLNVWGRRCLHLLPPQYTFYLLYIQIIFLTRLTGANERTNGHTCICEVKGCGKSFTRGEETCEKYTYLQETWGFNFLCIEVHIFTLRIYLAHRCPYRDWQRLRNNSYDVCQDFCLLNLCCIFLEGQMQG